MDENKSGIFCKDSEGGRQALGDLTNQLINRSSVSKPLSGSKRPAENLDDDSHFWKQVTLVEEKLEQETCGVAKCANVGASEVGLPCSKGGKTYHLQTCSGNVMFTDWNVGSGVQGVVVEVKEVCGATSDGIDLGDNQNLTNVVDVEGVMVKEDGFLGECHPKDCVEIGKKCQGEEMRALSDGGESDCTPEELATLVVSDNGKSSGGDCMASSRSESPETSRFSESQETRPFGQEKCRLLKGDGSNSFGGGMDLLKTCSCSFCAKAACIWSDLQCQDVKGRISTLTKSQKEASNLVRKHSVETPVGVAQGNSTTISHLESNLTTSWKSLFVHMENNFAAEINQLQSNFTALKDIREDCKMNLEMINVMPPEIQQCSSDASEF